MANFSRRAFLRKASLGVGSTLAFGPAVVSAGIEDGLKRRRGRLDFTAFNHGVASGDPLTDRVIIWTRVTPNARWLRRARIPVGWTVATDPDFNNIVRRGVTVTSRFHDFTVKVDLVGLRPGSAYYYKFNTFTADSPVGTTKTLTESSLERVKFAVMSCSNYPAGYFTVYQEASKLDLDAVLHLGDYIYEYGEGGYASENADAIGRGYDSNNDTELLTLADYRRRYAQYRTDAGLQALHASAPFICVWDDHEVANDAWLDGAENHQPDEGVWEKRRFMAQKAYFEWLPIRPPEPGNREKIFRSFSFGDLVDLHMLDTRLFGRDEQLNYLNYFPDGINFDVVSFIADIGNPDRTILGAEQLAWLQGKLSTSTGKYQVLGQQVLIGRMEIPAELLSGLSNPGPALFVQLQELATIKARAIAGDPTVTPEELARLSSPLPYNLDAWDGYPAEREAVFGAARLADQNLVVLAGDTHNAWANNLKDFTGTSVGVEFATASVSSPGLEGVLDLNALTAPPAEQVLQLLIDGLQYTNVLDRGFMTVTFTHEEALAEWTYVDNILSPEYSVVDSRTRRLRMRPGSGGRVIEEVS